MRDGMATMTHRTTFALDETTNQRIKSLAKLWSVSQAEVVRRAVSQAELPTTKPDPVAMLKQMHSQGAGLTSATAGAYLKEISKDRQNWRSK